MGATQKARIDPLNAEQAHAWDGGEGSYWAEHADRFDRSVAGYDDRLLDGAALAASDAVLDVGCGAGRTTLDAARMASSGSAFGVDLSSQLIDVARLRAETEGASNARFEQADAQIYPFEADGFDVAISRTGAMFFGDPVAAFTNIARSLRSGGRIVLLAWRPMHDNEWIREFFGALTAGRDMSPPPPTAPGPFALSDPQRVRAILSSAGFGEVTFDELDAAMHFGSDAEDAQAFLLGQLGWLLADLDTVERNKALERLRNTLVTHETSEGVLYDSATWLITSSKT